MAFTIIITMLPRSKQPIGLAMFALSATFAPAIGPTIGGYLTENYGWEYIFYRQPGARRSIMLGMLWLRAGATADAARPAEARATGPASSPWRSACGALQTVLEEGNKDDWFGSPFIAKLR